MISYLTWGQDKPLILTVLPTVMQEFCKMK